MIIIITGASHTGKTYLAQRMLEKYHYPYLSIDHLKMGLIRSGCTGLTPENDIALTDYLFPIVKELIKTAIENKQNLIVEGCYIPFNWKCHFEKFYLKQIRFICLAMTDKYIEKNFDKIVKYESIIENRFIDTNCTIDKIKIDNKFYLDNFMKAGDCVTLIESNYEKTIESLL